MKTINKRTKTEITGELVEVFYSELRQLNIKNIDSILHLFSENVKWDIPGDIIHAPWVGKRKGKEDVRKFFELHNKYVEPLKYNVNKLLIDGENAVAIGTLSARMLSTNKIYNSHFIAHFVVRENKISEYFFSEDSFELANSLTKKSNG